MTDHSTSLRRRAAGIAATALMLANVLGTPAAVMAAGGPGTPPTLVNDVINTAEDTPATGNVLTNDINSSGVVPFTVTSFTQPAANVGSITIAANGAYTFTPAPNFSGSGSATYMASNTKHEVGPATITINVTPAQDPPVASDDTVTVVEDTATNVKAAILANDNDPDGDTLSVTGATNATGGSVDLSGGNVTFTPTANLCGDGAGSFDYTLSATGGTDTAHVTVNITCVNDKPHAVNDSASGDEDTDVTIAESVLVANDTDVENDTLSVSGVSNASGGSVSRSGGTVTFTPTADLCGNNAASFDYTVTDGTDTDKGHVTIDLTCSPDAPVAHNDTVSGTEDTDVVTPAASLAANDTDPDGDTLTVTDVSNASGGDVDLTGGTVTFTPDADACGDGAGSYDYTVDDGGHGGSDTGHVTVDLECTNDAPVAKDDTVNANEDTATDVTDAILGNDTDVDEDELSVSAVSNPTGGTVDLKDGVVTFTPTADACGTGEGSFDYDVTDGTDTDSAHVTVDVTCENDVPVANDDNASGTEDTDVVIDGADLTANDTDADGDSLWVSDVSGETGGTVSLDGGTVTFTPAADACDPDAFGFDYTVTDGTDTATGHVTVSIECVNDAPVAVDDSANGTEDTDLVISDLTDLTGNDTDDEGDALDVTAVSNPTGGTVDLAGGVITFSPAADACDPATFGFDYTVSDGTDSDTGHVAVSIECVDDAPVAVDDNASGTEDTDLVISDLTDLTGNDGDVDHDGLTVTNVSNPTGGTVDLTEGVITFTPTPDACDPDSFGFDYTVSDGIGSDTGHVTVSIECVNDTPVAVDDTLPGTEDTDLVITDLGDLLDNDSDVETADLAIVSVSDKAGGHVSYNILDDSITFTPTANLCGDGAASFHYTISDGDGGFDTADATIDLECVNDNPTAVDDTATVMQNSGAADHDVLANDTDIDGDSPLTLTGATIDTGAHGTASVNGTKVSYTPATGFAGSAVITYTISDGHGGSDTGTLTVTVTAVDVTPPTAHAPSVAFATGRIDSSAPLRITWSATDAGSGVASYEVQVSIAGKPFSAVYSGTGTSIVKFYKFRDTLVFRVRATDKKGNVSAWATAASRRIVAFQNKGAASKLTYVGRWHQVLAPAASGNGYAWTSTLKSRVSLTFKGRSVMYVAPRSSASGFVKVFVDGKLLGRFNLKTQSTQMGRIIASKTWGANGSHTIRIVNDQGGKRTNFDAFVVLK